MYISNGSACQQGSCPRSSWPQWDRIASDGLSQLCGPPMEQLRRLGHHIVSHPQKANLSLPRRAVTGLPAAGRGWPHAQHFPDPCFVLYYSRHFEQVTGPGPDSRWRTRFNLLARGAATLHGKGHTLWWGGLRRVSTL